MRTRNWLLLAALTSALAATGSAAARWHPHNNPPGPIGGRGTNWANPPGWRGGPGASPQHRWYVHEGRRYDFVVVGGGYWFNPVYGYWHPRYGFWNQVAHCWIDPDGNPPGSLGGRGTNWENPPGWRGGPGASPDRYGRCR